MIKQRLQHICSKQAFSFVKLLNIIITLYSYQKSLSRWNGFLHVPKKQKFKTLFLHSIDLWNSKVFYLSLDKTSHPPSLYWRSDHLAPSNETSNYFVCTKFYPENFYQHNRFLLLHQPNNIIYNFFSIDPLLQLMYNI